MDIDIKIRNKIASTTDPAAIVCGNDGYRVNFDFDEEWQSRNYKTMRVEWLDTFSGRRRHTDVEFTGSSVDLPIIVDAYEIAVGVYAGDELASTPARLPCERSITDGATYHDEPEPDVYGQLLTALGRISAEPPIGSADFTGNAVPAEDCVTGYAEWEDL